MILKAIYGDCRRRKNKNLSIAWIDYQKVFDSVPHSWVEKSIELVGVNSKIVRFCKLSMEKWNTRLILKTKQEVMQSQSIQVRRGIFQCARICLKRGSVQSKIHVGSTFDNYIKELDPRKAYKYLGI